MTEEPILIETPRLIIRCCNEQDVDALEKILGDPEVMRYSLSGPLNLEGILEMIDKMMTSYEKHGYGLWGLIHKEEGKLIGLAGLLNQTVDQNSEIELSYRLALDYWGKGFATEAARAIKDYAFTKLNIERLISIIEPENKRSAQVAKNVGMIKAKSTVVYGIDVDIYDVYKIVLSPYSKEWEKKYLEEKKTLSSVFENHFIEFHHIGSTAIPGCDAKPVIDILGVTNDILEIDPYRKALENVGYVSLGEFGIRQRRFFSRREEPRVNLHIFEDSDPEVARHLRFRDYLKNHSNEKERYSRLKVQLAQVDPTDMKKYILGKQDLIKEIGQKAAWEDQGSYWNQGISIRRSVWKEEEIFDAMETNMHLQMTYFPKYLSNMRIIFEPDVTIVTSTIQSDTYNYIIGARFDEKDVSTRIARILELFRGVESPFSWWVGEKDSPSFLEDELKSQGLSPMEENVGMYLSLQERDFSRKNKQLSIRRILDQKTLKDFTDILVQLGEYPHIYEELYSKIPPVLYGEGAPYEFYVGYIDEIPIVTGILVLHANVGGIYYIATIPEYRKRGFATEMMFSLLMQAKSKGYHLVTLQASESGKEVYQKMGFVKNCQFVEYSNPKMKQVNHC